MRIVLFARGRRLAWSRSFFGSIRARKASADGTAVELQFVDGMTRDHLVSLTDRPIDILVLVDHFPFVAGPLAKEFTPAQAVRAEGQCAVFVIELARRSARVIALGGDDPRTWIAALEGIVADGMPAPTASPLPPAPIATGLPSTTLLSTYLEPLFAAAAVRTPELALAWPRDCFLDGDNPGKTLPAVIEVAGRGRNLTYGPYLPIPAGRWLATAYLGFSPEISKMPFIFEADTGGDVSRALFEVEQPGIFTLVHQFEVTDPLHPVEMRLISGDAALQGQASLIEVALKPVAA
jgi:hypothetical protein